MSSPTLLERAKMFMQRKGATTALAIAPLALATPTNADPVQFSLITAAQPPFLPQPFPIISSSSGGIFGNAFQAFSSLSSGVKLTGDTDITGLGTHGHLYGFSDPLQSGTGYLSAAHAAQNNGIVALDWGGDLSGDIHHGDILTLAHDFSINEQNGTNSTGAPLTWTLTAWIQYLPDGNDPSDPVTLSYFVPTTTSPLGSFSGVGGFAFPTNGQGLSWQVELKLNWQLTDDPDPTHGGPLNPYDRLAVDIHTPTSIDLSIERPAAGPAVPTPLPSTAWACGSLLGIFGLVRVRKALYSSNRLT